MTGYTTPDSLPYPNDYNEPADVPAATEALADATQTGLSARRTAVDTDARYVATAGSTMTGNLTIDKSGAAVYLDGGSSTKAIYYRLAGLNRWVIAVGDATDLSFNRYNDSGVYWDSPLILDRSTGQALLGPNAVDPLWDNSVASRKYVDEHGSLGGVTGEYTLTGGESGQYTVPHNLGVTPNAVVVSAFEDDGVLSIVCGVKGADTTNLYLIARNLNNSVSETFRMSWIVTINPTPTTMHPAHLPA